MENLNKEPHLVEGGLAVDDRGEVVFLNNFDFQGIQRFYCIENFSVNTIRAWHGHLREAKYIFLISGSAIVAAVKMDNTEKPNKENKVYRFVLTSRKPAIIFIPPGYANGFRAIEPKTKFVIFSTSSLEESKKDDYRFPYDYWGKELWEVQNR